MKKVSELNVLIIGCGKIALQHAKNLRSLGVQLAFYARQPEKAQSFAEKFGGHAYSGKLEDALEAGAFDATWICTPPSSHLSILEICLARKLKCFCEKPLLARGEELEKLARIPLAADLIMVGENYLYRPMLLWLETASSSHNLGKILEVRVRKESFQKVDDWRLNESALVEGGIHFIALILEILEYPVLKDVSISSAHNQKSFRVIAKTASSQSIELLYSWTNRWSLPAGLLQTSSIRFERGLVTFESNGLYAKLVDERGRNVESKFFSQDLGGFRAMSIDALEWIRGAKQTPKSTYHKAAAALGFALVKPLESGV